MYARILYKTRKTDRKPRSQRYKFRVLEMLIQRGSITEAELAELLNLSQPSIRKVTHSLALSGLIAQEEMGGQRMMITDTGARVWNGACREQQEQLERRPDNFDFVQQLASSNGVHVG
ncbi:MarR family transcriptional regulator [Paenibacillus oenotherae]|uniref:MarR family transcriptional regulator n=1 Tax=Paenibacillus oenotherae TaxID=1435645 RepID=A0ABS7DAB3_9BACL|nr:MarR family transcriptional regulator [Paenibacillus oenotherae]MBW7476883.1 MarR family transcriptional regulator [Paenibacillus oenotherae]